MLQRKRKTKSPCPECFLHPNLCICEVITSIQTKAKLSLIVHAKELKRTTNTGRLALKVLENSQMIVRGQNREPVDLSPLINDDYQSLLFFPADDAVQLTESFIKNISKPIHLLVPDGNWRQASKVAIRHPELKTLPRVMITKPNMAREHLRAESSEIGMATLQAIAEAFRIIEGETSYELLMKVYRAKLENTLKGRGQQSRVSIDPAGSIS
ncbi:MAG: DTW domain-containing protein [Bdellovibrio sp. CG10_big_fil_rev_8_21_14_0_10_47_8]|nr:MAG: DTW domain-containing protein [Bdellovibrio sp. CG10_big_fil_rev_8_21_14_0_10_47_8]